jgi:aldehyde dehydrogenase (NAD+)
MVDQVEPAFRELRENFKRHTSKSYEWRVQQLKAFKKGYLEMEREFKEAMF